MTVVDGNGGSNVGPVWNTTIYAFGVGIKSLQQIDGSGTGSQTHHGNWTLIRNGTEWDVYSNGTYIKQITPVGSYPHDLIFWAKSDAYGTNYAEIKIYNVTYEYGNQTVQNFTTDIVDETLWTYEACNSDGECSLSLQNRTITLDKTPPNITITSPVLVPVLYQGLNITMNWTAADNGNLDTCWFQYNDVNTTISNCLDLNTSFIYGLNNNSLIFYANDTLNNINETLWTWNYSILEREHVFNVTSYDLRSERFNLNFSYFSGDWSSISANLIYNGTSYAGTQSGTSNDLIFYRDLEIPSPTSSPINNSFYWEILLTNATGTFEFNSTIQNQTINEITLARCNATYTTRYLNITALDEGNLTILNWTIPTSTFVYWLDDVNNNKTLSFTNNTGNLNYPFCYGPVNDTINIDYSISYEASGYPQRIYSPDATTLSNTTTNLTLYLLNTNDGIYVTFQVINPGEQPVNDVVVTGTRLVGSTQQTVAQGTTDDAGAVTFWLNPDISHTFTFEHPNYETFTTTLTPTQSSYTITLGGVSTVNDDYTRGISYTINPSNYSLVNDTSYDFDFILNSSIWVVEEFGFVLFNENGTSLGSVSSSANGGTVTLNRNVGTNDTITLNGYWVINSTYSNFTKSWKVISTGLVSYSILNFFQNFSIHLNSKIFGLDNFGLAIITFLFIFVFTGIMSKQYGLQSPAAIGALIFSLVLFLDVGVGLITNLNPVGAVAHFPTVFVGIIALGLIFKEVWR